ncbi:MAG: hypothetical protein AAFX06_06895 [Planctomycetota bacterium]
MNAENPYDSPPEPVGQANPSLLVWTSACVFGTGLVGGVFGALIGAVLGSLWPGYYESVFRNGDSASFDPIAVGIGQGLTQGVVFGSLIGLALVALFYWYRSRLQTQPTDSRRV